MTSVKGWLVLVVAIALMAASPAADAATVDTAFAPEPNGPVGAIALQADGKVLIGGAFTSVGTTPVRHLARLLPDGTVDPSFTTVVDGPVHVIKVQPDSSVFIGGSFTQVDGQAWGALARLDAGGRLDVTFAPAVKDGSVGSIAVMTDGRVVVGGNFKTVGGVARPLLARLALNGSLDETFNPELGGVESVFAVAQTSDGALVVSASAWIRFFRQPLLLKLGDTGARVSGFSVSLLVGDPAPIVLIPGANDTLLAGGYGSFESLLTIDADGTILSSGKFGTSSGSGGISAVTRHADGRLSLGGVFDNLFGGPTPHRNVARTAVQGGVDVSYRVNANDAVVALAVQADGALLIGGFFTQINGTPRNFLARVLDESAEPASIGVTDGARVRWTLPAAAPHLTHAELQWSADGQHFARHRSLERTPSGWEGLVGSLPDGARWVRAAGPDASGTSMIGSPALDWPTFRPVVGEGPAPY